MRRKRCFDPAEILGIIAGMEVNEHNEATDSGFKVDVLKLQKIKPLIEYQANWIKEKAAKHLEKFRRVEIIKRGLLFKLEEIDEMLKIGEKLENEGFVTTLDVMLMRLGSPILGGYIYVYDMDRRNELLSLADKINREFRILPGEPLEEDKIENLFLDCLAVDYHYDHHAIWLWLKFKNLQEKYDLVAPPHLVKYVYEAELAYLKDFVEKVEKKNMNERKEDKE